MTRVLPAWHCTSFARHLLVCLSLMLGGFLRLPAQAQPSLSLPFFDDFSTGSSPTARGGPGNDRPDPALWLPGSGVYINNTMSTNHPTVGMASFDGLAANGLPYVRNNQFAQGYTDTLASKPINIAGLTPADSVFLSFYWQARGQGELPDAGDSLTVQFLDRSKVWRTIWRAEGGVATNNFTQVFISVPDAYLHGAFAFRFRSYGRESGPFDTWNIDYVYLNRGRSRNDRSTLDLAVRMPLSPLLKQYTAMPMAQYKVNPLESMAQTVTTEIKSLKGAADVTTFRFSVLDEGSGQVLQNDQSTIAAFINPYTSQPKSVSLTPFTNFSKTRAVLRQKFTLITTGETGDVVNPDKALGQILGVDLRRNDTLSAQTVLDDYYAYDDGSWEFGLQVGPRERVAVQYILNKPDTMSGVRLVIVPFRTNQTGQPFVVTVFGNGKGQNNKSQPGAPIYQKLFATQYAPYRNGFVEFRFDRGVAVKDTFYVGYQQISTSDTTFLRLGFDKNSPFGRQIFYNGGNNWDQNQSGNPLFNINGAFMLRPVMGGKGSGLVTALPEPEPLVPLRAYPNPTTGLIRWDSPLTRLEVFSTSGQLLHIIEPERGQQTANLGHLPDGLYLLRLWAGDQAVAQKLLIYH